MRTRQLCLAFLLIILCVALGSCTRTARRYAPKNEAPQKIENSPLTRADPAYLQYLERNSMLGKSYEMAQVVSGSELAWRVGSGSSTAMLNYADTWLFVHPLTVLTTSRASTFSQLTDTSTWPVLREAAIKGIYIAPLQGSGSLWAKRRSGVDTGEDAVQYDFSRSAGSEAQYQRLMSAIIDNHGLLGSDLIPAATGLGPDFFLAARAVREYPGIYCMVDIPETLWSHLPSVATEWDVAPLSRAQVDALNARGMLPKSMRDEISPLAGSGGWAATGVVRGVDGNNRRWVYRYYERPEYAVLNWEDPSQTAHRILSGSAVRQVGLQGQAMLGLRFEAFQGLEAAPAGMAGDSFNLEPALTAAASMSREIRRYGGWSWLRDDDLPLHSIRDFLRAGADFVFDGVFSPAVEHALLTGDASLARFMADEALRLEIDARRLVHTTPAQAGINYTLPHLSYLAATSEGDKAADFKRALQASMYTAAAHEKPVPVKDGYLHTTSAGLAAMALKSSENIAEIAKGHSLLLFFKAMQPGVLMLSGQDLSGVLPLSYTSMASSAENWDVSNASRGSYGLTASAAAMAVSSLGMPKADQAYPSPDLQVHKPDSFLKRTGKFLIPRNRYNIAKGTLVARPATKGKGSIALVTRMPDGKSYLLSVCNFSRSKITEQISLAKLPGIKQALTKITPIATGGQHSVAGQLVTITLEPWQGRALLIGTVAEQADAEAERETVLEKTTPIPKI